MASAEQRLLGMIMAVSGSRAKEGPLVNNNCRKCVNRRDVPGNCHIECVNPDMTMTGDPHGIKQGWFMYPILFDPTWMTSECKNFEPVSRAVESSGKPE